MEKITSKEYFKCNICKNDFFQITSSEFLSHIKSHLLDKKQPLENQNSISNCQTKVEKSFKCDICDKVLKSESGIQHHKLVTHDNVVRLKCDICPKTFTVAKNLREHQKNRVENPGMCLNYNPKVCNLCHKSFKHPCHVKYHKQRVHENYRPFECESCGKTFSNLANLQTHVDIKHKKLKPHQCDGCDMKFFTKDSMQRHKDRKHANDPDYFGCNMCDKKFAAKRSLKSHILDIHEHKR